LNRAYTVYSIGRESVAGAIGIEPDWGRVPDRWQVIFAVTDLARTIEQVNGLGGCDDLPPIDIPAVGRIASLLDDRKGLFFAIQPVTRSG
jgi:predicted enzyme related to lactoylglutathione lyase